MRLVNWLLGILMVFVVGAVVVTAYSTESHGDGKVEVYGIVQQRGEPFIELRISYAMDAGETQFATLSATKAKFTTPKKRLTPGSGVTVFIRYEPPAQVNKSNERRCRIYVERKPVFSSPWEMASKLEVCRWSI